MQKITILLSMLGLIALMGTQSVAAAPKSAIKKNLTKAIDSSLPKATKNEANKKLLASAEAGDLQAVMEAIEQDGADIDAANDKGSTALMIASVSGYEAIVDYLINKAKVKPNVNAQNKKGLTALMGVVSTGNLKIAKILVENGKADVNLKNEAGYSVVAMAVSNKRFNIVKYLIEKGNADIETPCPFGNTLLIHAIMDKDEQLIKYLIEVRKVSAQYINRLNNVGENALDFAEFDYPEIVNYLVSKGAIPSYEVK